MGMILLDDGSIMWPLIHHTKFYTSSSGNDDTNVVFLVMQFLYSKEFILSVNLSHQFTPQDFLVSKFRVYICNLGLCLMEFGEGFTPRKFAKIVIFKYDT